MVGGASCLRLMERIAAHTGLEVNLMCDAPLWAEAPDRWIAHVGGRVFGKGPTGEAALEDLLNELGLCEWAQVDELDLSPV